MLEFIRGRIDRLTPTAVTIESNSGIGFLLNISLATFTALEGLSMARLMVHEVVREDAYLLYGFNTEQEREMFRMLIGVSGVGATTAIMILSAMSIAEIEAVITSSDVKRLKSVKGIGAKTAERIIVDLRDKIKPSENTLLEQFAGAGETFDEALTALTVLGYAKPQAQKVLKKLFDETPTLKVEVAIRKALAMM